MSRSGERTTGRLLEASGQRVHRVGGDEDVALDGVARARRAAGPVEARRARVARGPALTVHDADLALVAVRVAADELRDDLVRRPSGTEQLESAWAVREVGARLGRHGADFGLRGRHRCADRKELGLNGHTPLARLQVAGDDRVGRDAGLRGGSAHGLAADRPRERVSMRDRTCVAAARFLFSSYRSSASPTSSGLIGATRLDQNLGEVRERRALEVEGVRSLHQRKRIPADPTASAWRPRCWIDACLHLPPHRLRRHVLLVAELASYLRLRLRLLPPAEDAEEAAESGSERRQQPCWPRSARISQKPPR